MRNEKAILALIDELEGNIALCDAFLDNSRWSVIEHAAGTRRRAAATLRAVLRWYGMRTADRRTATEVPAEPAISDIVAANRRLIAAYDRARDVADSDAPESRLLDEQVGTLLADRAEISRYLQADLAGKGQRRAQRHTGATAAHA